MKKVSIWLLITSAAVFLSACSNSDRGVRGGDNFINSVRAVINNTSETADAERLDDFAGATNSETAEPQAL